MTTVDELIRSAAMHFQDVEWAHAADLNLSSIWPSQLDRQESEWGPVRVLRVPTAFDDRTGYADAVMVSNFRSLMRDFGESAGLREIGYDGDHGLLVILDAHPEIDGADEWDSDTREHLFDAIESLFDYAMYDENDLSDLEVETESECWESYGRSELRAELNRAGYGSIADSPDDELDDAWLEAVESQNIYVEFDGMSAYWRGLADADTLKAVAEALTARVEL